ncbi:hypothetical protein GIB23_20375 [Pseudomonas putida]|uniref:hypothetical protein n=1 Tax=Pseudomonas putida TaxID=303 RepID=UPI001A8F4020|nr:hypothetical protein [Pseudomonas putida]MBO0369436.1 hypothetical protein [Pseudomonas putida]
MEHLKTGLVAFLCLTSAFSAFSWAKSATAHVPAKIPGSIIVWEHEDGTQTDLKATMDKQSKWNKIAAAFAAVAAVTQAGLALLP